MCRLRASISCPQVWNAVKNSRAGNAAPWSKDELKKILMSALFAFQKLPRKIRSFFEYPDTRYTLAWAE